jgi:hypothetical protein
MTKFGKDMWYPRSHDPAIPSDHGKSPKMHSFTGRDSWLVELHVPDGSQNGRREWLMATRAHAGKWGWLSQKYGIFTT